MTDRIDFGGEPWQAIPRQTLRDPQLSPRALGGLVTLLSHEEGWVRSCIAILQHEKACGRKQAQAIMAELRDAGYAELVHERREDSNLLLTRYTVHAVSQSAGSQADLSTAPTYRKPSGSETERVGSRSAVVEALEEEPLDEESQSLVLASDDALTPNQRGNVLAKVYADRQPMCNFPAVASIARKAIKANHTDAEIEAALLRLADEGRSLTTESLRLEIEGMPERHTRTPDRAMEIARGAYGTARS